MYCPDNGKPGIDPVMLFKMVLIQHLFGIPSDPEKGTIVDSTFIESPSSTKNKDKKCDLKAHSAKNSNTWNFKYKAYTQKFQVKRYFK